MEPAQIAASRQRRRHSSQRNTPPGTATNVCLTRKAAAANTIAIGDGIRSGVRSIRYALSSENASAGKSPRTCVVGLLITIAAANTRLATLAVTERVTRLAIR